MLKLNYKTFGEGRPLIMLHGLFGSSRNWQGMARAISDTHQVIIPDMRNHGESPHASSMSYFDMAKDVIHLIDELKLSNPIILGHSMGGKVAMTIALSQPDYLSGLVIVDIAPVNYDHDFSELIAAMNSLCLSDIRQRAEAEKILVKKIESEKLVAFIMQNLVRGEDGFHWRINLEQVANSLPELGQFPEDLKDRHCRAPTLFIGGAYSSYLRSIYNPAIFQHFPAAEIKMIDDAGHWVHADKPKEFLEQILSFIHYI